jgi:hypothetical protein
MANRTPEDIMEDPTASDWLIAALGSALRRDPVDAANDAEVLYRLLDRRCKELSVSLSLHIPLDDEAP